MSGNKDLILRSENESHLVTTELLERGAALAARYAIPIDEAIEQQADQLCGEAIPHIYYGEAEKARDLLDQALRLHPRHIGSRAGRAHMRHLLGDLEGAIIDFQWYIALAPHMYEAHIDLAVVYMETKETEAAKVQFKIAFEKMQQAWKQFPTLPHSREYELGKLKNIFEISRQLQQDAGNAELYFKRSKLRISDAHLVDLYRTIHFNPHHTEANSELDYWIYKFESYDP